jgi:hypothetical protein
MGDHVENMYILRYTTIVLNKEIWKRREISFRMGGGYKTPLGLL